MGSGKLPVQENTRSLTTATSVNARKAPSQWRKLTSTIVEIADVIAIQGCTLIGGQLQLQTALEGKAQSKRPNSKSCSSSKARSQASLSSRDVELTPAASSRINLLDASLVADVGCCRLST